MPWNAQCRCSAAVAERNANFPDDERIKVRIGINLGEVIVDGDDRYGEGVNIAARLEQLADPGGICVSGKVAREVEKKLAFGFESMGDQQVKNMAEAVPAYRVVLDGSSPPKRLAALRAGSARRPGWATALGGGIAALIIAAAASGFWLFHSATPADAGPPTVAVLPLSNIGGDPALQYFADGATETLISDLARSPEIRVIARTSSDAYRGKAIDVRQIGKELNATYIVEGSIQKSGETLRIVAQLIDARSGEHVWAEHYDKEGADPLALQDEVAARIVGTLAGEQGLIKRRQFDEAWGKDSSSLDEYSYYLRGHELFYHLNKADTEKAIQIWMEGLEKFPTSSLLKVKLGIGLLPASVRWMECGHREGLHACGSARARGPRRELRVATCQDNGAPLSCLLQFRICKGLRTGAEGEQDHAGAGAKRPVHYLQYCAGCHWCGEDGRCNSVGDAHTGSEERLCLCLAAICPGTRLFRERRLCPRR